MLPSASLSWQLLFAVMVAADPSGATTTMSADRVPFPSSGGADGAPDAPLGHIHPSRRHFYAPGTGKPFSRSAAKRQSVMALGSIQHLQHFYVKAGLSASDGAAKVGSVLAVPGSSSNTLSEEPEEDEEGEASEDASAAKKRPPPLKRWGSHLAPTSIDELPPSPAKPQADTRMPWEKKDLGKTVKNEKELRSEVLQALEAVSQKWGLVTQLSRNLRRGSRSVASSTVPEASEHSTESSDRPLSSLSVRSEGEEPSSASLSTSTASEDMPFVLDLMHTTTAAIRSVQKYSTSLPASVFVDEDDESGELLTKSPGRKPSTVSTAARPLASDSLRRSSVSNKPGGGGAAGGKTDPLLAIRKEALLLLQVLKDIEVKYRVPGSGPTEDPFSFKHGDDRFDVSDDEEDEEHTLEQVYDGSGGGGPTSPFDAGYMYDPAIGIEDVRREVGIDTVRQYIATVDRVLFRDRLVARNKNRSSRRSKKSSLLGHRRSPHVGEELAVEGLEIKDEGPSDDDDLEEEEEELPEWAKEDTFVEEDVLGRAHSLLSAFLPSRLRDRLPSSFSSDDPSSRLALLEALSDGLLLCTAYNLVLRSSARPFGFIASKDIHDLPSSSSSSTSNATTAASTVGEAGLEKVGLLFRKIQNLTVWSSACKFRYDISPDAPAVMVGLGVTSSTAVGGAAGVAFDPRVVARKEKGWEERLEGQVGRWVGKVVLERRVET